MPTETHARVTLRSSDTRLDKGFAWAKKQALAYVFEGDPVGPWYEASLPGRAAFCMRDVSHQAAGAQVLGLQKQNANMLFRFAEAIDKKRDWCSYWEIDKTGAPCAVDYQNDQAFWYNLPANFDVLDACYRMFLWTGDRAYVDDPAFLNFYARTVDEYVKRWDRDGDGLVEGRREDGARGIGSYNESFELQLAVTSETLLKEYAAFRDYARILDFKGRHADGRQVDVFAERLGTLYRTKWWDPKMARHIAGIHYDGTPYLGERCLTEAFLCDETPSPAGLKELVQPGHDNVEELSYLPETFYRHDLDEEAYVALLRIMDPKLKRRDYPEVSYAAVGAVAEGLMGIAPDARVPVVATLARLPASLDWAELSSVPVFRNTITVRHEKSGTTTFTNASGPTIRWRAEVLGNVDVLYVGGKPAPEKTVKRTTLGGNLCSAVDLTVTPGQTLTVARSAILVHH